MNKSDWLSVLATAISILSFFASALIAIWRTWRERPRLSFSINRVIRHTHDEEFVLVEVKVSNIGFRPIILTSFAALGRSTTYFMGDIDPTAAAYNRAIDVFPIQLQPGNTIKFYPMTIEALEQNQANSAVPEYRWLFFVVVDSFGKFFHMDIYDVLFELSISKKWQPKTRWQRIRSFILLRSLAARAVKSST